MCGLRVELAEGCWLHGTLVFEAEEVDGAWSIALISFPIIYIPILVFNGWFILVHFVKINWIALNIFNSCYYLWRLHLLNLIASFIILIKNLVLESEAWLMLVFKVLIIHLRQPQWPVYFVLFNFSWGFSTGLWQFSIVFVLDMLILPKDCVVVYQ